jgi:hypothetical protein
MTTADGKLNAMAVRTAIALIFLSTLMTACSRVNSPDPPEFAGAEHSTPLEWVEGKALAQDANRIIMRANNDGRLLHIDLSTVGVFDCRIDCFSTPGRLDKIELTNRLCLGFLHIEDGVQVGKLWINRYECPGRTTPP